MTCASMKILSLPRLVMVLLLRSNSEIDVHVRCNLCNLICLRRLIRSRAVTNRFILQENIYFSSYVRNLPELPSNTSTMRLVKEALWGIHSHAKLRNFIYLKTSRVLARARRIRRRTCWTWYNTNSKCVFSPSFSWTKTILIHTMFFLQCFT